MNDVAVIIPIYKDILSTYEQISLNQCLNIFSSQPIIIVAPEKLKNGFINKAYENNLLFLFVKDRFLSSIQSYNTMLLSKWFYEHFLEYQYILIYQLDCFVFKNDLDKWVKKQFSYVGAPWVDKNGDFNGVGNGGFSLRNVNDSIRVLNSRKRIHPFSVQLLRAKKVGKYFSLLRALKWYWQSSSFKTAYKNRNINEDKTFSHAGNRLPFFKIPKEEIAMGFAFEKAPNKLYQLNNYQLPFGCHAWWRYDLDFFKRIIEEFGYLVKKSNE